MLVAHGRCSAACPYSCAYTGTSLTSLPHLPVSFLLSPQSHSLRALKARYVAQKRAHKRNAELHSLRCDLEYKLTVARCG